MDRRIFQQFIVDNFKITESIILDRFLKAFHKSSVSALLTPITRIFKYFDGQHQQPGSQSDGDISNRDSVRKRLRLGLAAENTGTDRLLLTPQGIQANATAPSPSVRNSPSILAASPRNPTRQNTPTQKNGLSLLSATKPLDL